MADEMNAAGGCITPTGTLEPHEHSNQEHQQDAFMIYTFPPPLNGGALAIAQADRVCDITLDDPLEEDPASGLTICEVADRRAGVKGA
jgi:hypothetical protein